MGVGTFALFPGSARLVPGHCLGTQHLEAPPRRPGDGPEKSEDHSRKPAGL